MAAVKKSFEAAVEAGYDLIHVDPTVDITLGGNQSINIESVTRRTLDLIIHIENFRRRNKYPRISFEVGTEEVHGGLANIELFRRFLEMLKQGLAEEFHLMFGCFVVGKVGTGYTSLDLKVQNSC
jgi:hypothetical protein